MPWIVVAGSFAGAAFARARSTRSRTRVDVYFRDGSMVSLPGGSPDADRVLPVARELLRAAGGRG